jgi:hypothetical protein
MTAPSYLLLGATTMILWVVPSLGTQGMGTIGRRVVHPDAVLLDADPVQRAAARGILTHADAVAEAALGD